MQKQALPTPNPFFGGKDLATVPSPREGSTLRADIPDHRKCVFNPPWSGKNRPLEARSGSPDFTHLKFHGQRPLAASVSAAPVNDTPPPHVSLYYKWA